MVSRAHCQLSQCCDTVAAVTGQLAGAVYGLSGIPKQWVDRIAWRDRLLETAQNLSELGHREVQA